MSQLQIHEISQLQIYEILQLQIYEISQLQIYEISQLQLQDDIGVSGVVGSAVFNITLVCFIFLKRKNITIKVVLRTILKYF